MSTISFVSKKPAGPPGNFNYEYTCTCAGGVKKSNVVVASANDNAARMLAQLECDDSCGETMSVKPSVADAELTSPISIIHIEDADISTTTVMPDRVFVGPPTVNPQNFPCVAFFAAGINRVGIRNNCTECKIAVVMWAGVGVYNYKVPAYGQIIVPMASNNGQLIGEQPC